jgi:hypothetical protein
MVPFPKDRRNEQQHPVTRGATSAQRGDRADNPPSRDCKGADDALTIRAATVRERNNRAATVRERTITSVALNPEDAPRQFTPIDSPEPINVIMLRGDLDDIGN